jgi:SUKH-3 immunity protein of toxin-antitoxin system
MREMSKQTAECLTRAGWHRDRLIDTSGFEASLRTAGFNVLDAAVDFLKQFGGLHIGYPHAKVVGREDEMHFDPSIVAKHIQPIKVNGYSKVIGKELCPVGEAARGYLTLMMGKEGQVYASYDDFFALVGTSGLAAIETLCTGKDLDVIPIDDYVRRFNSPVLPEGGP